MSNQKKLRDAQKEKEAVDAELRELESSMSTKGAIQDVENRTTGLIKEADAKIQAENDLHARNLASIK